MGDVTPLTDAERDARIAELEASDARMRNAIIRAAMQFDYYAQQHSAKRTPDADKKAAVNVAFAAQMRAALRDEP